MKSKTLWSKILAIAGTVLVWLPILFMLITGVAGSIMEGRILCDYLIPAEVGFLVISGAGLLLVAAILAGKYVKHIAWTIGIGAVLVIGCMAITLFTGLAHGDVQPEQIPIAWGFALGMIITYDVAVAVLGIFGILLIRALFRKVK
jgi:hypothetical protein